jgi:hypothetical protein
MSSTRSSTRSQHDHQPINTTTHQRSHATLLSLKLFSKCLQIFFRRKINIFLEDKERRESFQKGINYANFTAEKSGVNKWSKLVKIQKRVQAILKVRKVLRPKSIKIIIFKLTTHTRF